MNLAIVSSPPPPELHSLRIAEDENLKACGRRRRASVILRPVSCFTSSSSSSSSSGSSPSQEGAAAGASATATAIAQPPLRRPEKPSSDLANFKPPPPARPENPKDLATDLPFQYWYSYADLPPGIPKRKSKNPLSILTSEDRESRDCLDKGETGSGGNGSGGLWEAVLAVESESNLDTTKVGKQRRGGSNGGGGGGGVREAERGLLSTNYEKRLTAGRATAGDLQEDGENTPLTEKEKKKLILSCHGTNRQINVGWEGWHPNYIPLVHTYWKRSSVCKIKCKGVVTLNLDSFCELLEVETGGTVIHRVGGTVYLFRGRNYNYWRGGPQLLVRHPRIIKRFPKRLPVPANLTKEDIKTLRARGRELPALCQPGKHGVYLTLLDDVRKAFETQDLVRVNCQGFHSKNLKRLGSQLQELVPCELISFEFEHILMWRSKDGNSPNEEVTMNQSEESCLVSMALS